MPKPVIVAACAILLLVVIFMAVFRERQSMREVYVGNELGRIERTLIHLSYCVEDGADQKTVDDLLAKDAFTRIADVPGRDGTQVSIYRKTTRKTRRFFGVDLDNYYLMFVTWRSRGNTLTMQGCLVTIRDEVAGTVSLLVPYAKTPTPL